ncbi:MAG: UDP-N-acetylmuramate--L-alanine ligase [Candidatus Anammoxibacter sp.]
MIVSSEILKRSSGHDVEFDRNSAESYQEYRQNSYVVCQELPPSFSPYNDLHFVGIGGVGMSSVARLLKSRGYAVTGSDMLSNLATVAMEHLGIRINFQQNGQWIDDKTDLIIASAAIPDNNLDLIKARKLGIKIIKYSQLLGLLMKEKKGIAVSGTHGKTTTTAMISSILKTAGLDPACVIGGDTSDFNENGCSGNGDLFVTEACEYDRTFLNLTPQIAVITNIDEDHLDYYKNLKELQAAFVEFASSICSNGLLVINEHDCNIFKNISDIKCNIESFGILNKSLQPSAETVTSNCHHQNQYTSSDPTWSATTPVFKDGKSQFRVFYKGKFFGDFYILLPGVHNVMNALASIAVCCHAGVHKDFMSESFSSFKGVDRRFQVLGTVNDITIIDDYAHHPTAIQATLKAVKDIYPDRRVWCLFQPHQYSRTKLLLERFSQSFEHADKIILADIYSVRDSLEDMVSVSSLDIAVKIRKTGSEVEVITDHSKIEDVLCERLLPGDVLIVMGAGDICNVATNVLNKLNLQQHS